MQAPQILKDSPHWILRKGLQPVSISGNAIRWHNPNSWMNYEDACMAYEHHKEQIDGIGYIVTENEDPIDESNNGFVIDPESRFLKEEIVFMGDRIGLEADIDILSEEIGPSEEGKDIEGLLEEVIFLYRGMDPGEPQIAGIYLDNCRDQITGEFSSWARFVLNRLNSPSCINVSGTGFTIFCKCSLPPEYTERTVFGPDDLSEECKANLTKFEPDVALKVAKGESAFNLFKVHQCGPKHFPITGEWLEDYPLEMVDRTREVAEILCLWLPLKLPEALKSAFDSSGLPHLDILRIIDTSGFTAIGKEFVGQHPLFPAHLKVNPSSNIWYFFHEGSLIMGDAWIWLAAESGAVNWRDIVPNTLFDPAKVQKVKEYAVSKGYFAEDDLLPERKMIRDALQTVADLKDRALSDPGLPFEPQNVQALAIVKISNRAEYERVKGSWKDKISIRELNRSVEEQVCKIRASNILRSEPETMHTDSQMDEKKPIAEQILDTILKGDDSVELMAYC